MDLFGTDPATIRTAVSAQLLFGAMFFALSIRMLPGYRMLPMWALANLATFAALVVEGLSVGRTHTVLDLVGGTLMSGATALLWVGVRLHYNSPVNWRAGVAAGAALVLGAGVPLWLFGPEGLAYSILYHLVCALILLAAVRDYALSQRQTWTAQTVLLLVLMMGWGLFSASVGVLRAVHLLAYPLDGLVGLLRIPHAAGTTLIIIALNFLGFLLISQRLSHELNLLASTDSLTGVMNRRAFHRRAAAFFVRPAAPVSPSDAPRPDGPRPDAPCPAAHLLVLDLDNFKQVNDRHGHAAGDQVLIRFTDTVRQLLRTSDLFGRTGGEEFCVLLPEADEQAALGIAERIRSGVEAMGIEQSDGQPPIRVTVSIGVAGIVPGATFDQIAAEADKALYAAKNGGRNRVAKAAAFNAPRPREAPRTLIGAPVPVVSPAAASVGVAGAAPAVAAQAPLGIGTRTSAY